MAKISVIIPCYNRASLVGQSIQNMIDQSFKPFEIIVINDGSTDNSEEVIKSFGDKVRLINQENQGPGAARNAGFAASTGEYIQFMDSDDLASKNKLELQLKALQETNADFAYCPWVRSKIENQRITFIHQILQVRPLQDSKPMLEWFLSGWSLVFQNCLFKRSILQKAGIYRTEIVTAEDSEYFVRILLAGAVPVHTPDCLVFYREHTMDKITGTGTSATQRANDWTKFLFITGELLKEHIYDMQFGTRIALSANVSTHIHYCHKHDLPVLPRHHPYNNIPLIMKPFTITAYKLYQKLIRRLKNTPDYLPAFQSIRPSPKHELLIKQIGYFN